VRLGDYVETWLAGRDLSPKAAAAYRSMIRGRLAVFSDFTLDQLTPMLIKKWWEEMDKAAHPNAARRAYPGNRVEPDEDTDRPPLLPFNLARLSVKMLRRSAVVAGHFRPPRTRVQPATLEELDIIVPEMPDRYRAMVLLAAWCAPRFGELTELRRKDLIIRKDKERTPVSGVVHIVCAVIWPSVDEPMIKEPKSEAGTRDVAIPPHILPALVEQPRHLGGARARRTALPRDGIRRPHSERRTLQGLPTCPSDRRTTGHALARLVPNRRHDGRPGQRDAGRADEPPRPCQRGSRAHLLAGRSGSRRRDCTPSVGDGEKQPPLKNGGALRSRGRRARPSRRALEHPRQTLARPHGYDSSRIATASSHQCIGRRSRHLA